MGNLDNYQALIDKVQAQTTARRSKIIAQAGKEFVMLYLWLCQMKAGFKDEEAALYIATLLQGHPEELAEVLAYYERLKEYDLRKNIKGFVPSIIEGEMKVKIMWKQIELPEEGESQ